MRAACVVPPADQSATKIHRFERGELVGTDSYDYIERVRAVRAPLNSFDDLATVADAVAVDGAMIIRGEPRERIAFEDTDEHGLAGSVEQVNRRYKVREDKGPPDWKRSERGRRWLMIDLDDLNPPDWFPDEPSADDLRRAVEFARGELPPPFREAACWYQWSSSAGIPEWSKLKLHLLFWLDRPALPYAAGDPLADTIKGYFGRWNATGKGAKVDVSLYSPVQPHFVAAPVFKGTDSDGKP